VKVLGSIRRGFGVGRRCSTTLGLAGSKKSAKANLHKKDRLDLKMCRFTKQNRKFEIFDFSDLLISCLIIIMGGWVDREHKTTEKYLETFFPCFIYGQSVFIYQPIRKHP